LSAIRIVEYLDEQGLSPYARWFESLNPQAAARVTTALYRLGLGNTSSVKGVGGGVFEIRIDFGPGYRVYFGKDGETVVILLGGSSKQRQQAAITAALKLWGVFKLRKRAQR
jgi:putative addiction module killer protein